MLEVVLYLSDDFSSTELIGIVDFLVEEAKRIGCYVREEVQAKGSIPEELRHIFDRVAEAVYGPESVPEHLSTYGIELKEFTLSLPSGKIRFRLFKSRSAEELSRRLRVKVVPSMNFSGRRIEKLDEIKEVLERIEERIREAAPLTLPRALDVISEKIRSLEQLYMEGKIDEERYRKMREVLERLRYV